MNHIAKIELFGGLRVRLGDRSISRFNTRKTAILLAYLAYYRHQSHPREVLIEMLWPDCAPTSGRSRLSNALWSLRRQLEPPGTPAGSVLHANHFTVGLDSAAVTIDVTEFVTTFLKATRAADPSEHLQGLRTAMELYRGELLPGFYEDWVLTERRRLNDVFEQAQQLLNAPQTQESALDVLCASLPEPGAASAIGASDSLPVSFTRFFGREAELARLQKLLSPTSPLLTRPRLVTITGTGGTGKTRLSLEIARRLQQGYAGSIRFAPLADLRDPTLIAGSLADALALPRSDHLDPLEQVVGFLNARKDTPSLLVLDNFEHLVEGGAQIVQSLLERAPALTLLVTSRRLLNLTSEREFALLPLAVPQAAEPLERSSLYESVQLFIDRAQNARSDFQVTNKNAPAVAELCHRLEGIPLALELAAARALMLTPAQMLSQMERRFAFLVSKKRDVVARHRSLQATIDWSYRLLSAELQRFFARLSVFRGGWTLEASEAVCEEPQALEYLEQLREWSLVLVAETETGMRYRMLETLREYALEQLSKSDCAGCQERHAKYFAGEIAQTRQRRSQLGDALYYRSVSENYDNTLAALEWAKEGHSDPDLALRLAHDLTPYWRNCGSFREGQRHLGEALARDERDPWTELRAWVVDDIADLALQQGDLVKAKAFTDWSLRNWNVLGKETRWMARALTRRGFVHEREREYSAADAVYQESLNLCAQLGEREVAAYNYNALGGLNYAQERYDRAREYWERTLTLHRELGRGHNVAVLLNNLSTVAIIGKDFDRALELIEQALALYQEMDGTAGRASALANLAALKVDLNDYPTARQLYEESLSIFRQMADMDTIPLILLHYGRVLYKLGEASSAWGCYKESLLLYLQNRDEEGMVRGLEAFGEWDFVHGNIPRAVRLYSIVMTLGESIGIAVPDESADEHWRPETMRLALSEKEYTDAWEAGRAMSWQEAVAFALEGS